MPKTVAQTIFNPPHTVHLTTASLPDCVRPSVRKGLRLSNLQSGETARVLRLAFADPGCRKRFAELGLAEGMKVTVACTGDALMLLLVAPNGPRRPLRRRNTFVSPH